MANLRTFTVEIMIFIKIIIFIFITVTSSDKIFLKFFKKGIYKVCFSKYFLREHIGIPKKDDIIF